MSGSEPADSVRAVNALLTALDSLKAHPNVMMLTTSNITEAIDVAFLDRADIKAYLGPPELQACASLAVAVDIVVHSSASKYHAGESALFVDSRSTPQLWALSLHHQLMIHGWIVQNCRAALYKLPVI